MLLDLYDWYNKDSKVKGNSTIKIYFNTNSIDVM